MANGTSVKYPKNVYLIRCIDTLHCRRCTALAGTLWIVYSIAVWYLLLRSCAKYLLTYEVAAFRFLLGWLVSLAPGIQQDIQILIFVKITQWCIRAIAQYPTSRQMGGRICWCEPKEGSIISLTVLTLLGACVVFPPSRVTPSEATATVREQELLGGTELTRQGTRQKCACCERKGHPETSTCLYTQHDTVCIDYGWNAWKHKLFTSCRMLRRPCFLSSICAYCIEYLVISVFRGTLLISRFCSGASMSSEPNSNVAVAGNTAPLRAGIRGICLDDKMSRYISWTLNSP